MNCLNFKRMLSDKQRKLVNSGTPFVFKLPGAMHLSGNLNYWQNNEIFPEGIQRCFWVYEVDQDMSRGNHAHLTENQVIVAMSGKIEVDIESVDGQAYQFLLDHPSRAVFLPPKHWIITRFETSAVLLGMCNEAFSEVDYIRDRAEFKNLEK